MTGDDIRKVILKMHHAGNQGHVGCSLSIADIICAINPGASGTPEFVLSKGHAASALYAALYLNGKIPFDLLEQFGSAALPGHPHRPLVRVATGSLGMGLSIACGIALSKKDNVVSVLASDAELNEGAMWEAFMFAGHQKLCNLKLFVDRNGQQATGKTKDIIDIRSIWSSLNNFGWDCYYGPGHDIARMREWLHTESEKPSAYVADTIFGKGVSFMEEQLDWHYRTMTDSEYCVAKSECERNS